MGAKTFSHPVRGEKIALSPAENWRSRLPAVSAD
jgi:hypothetical protein